ncbi:DUF4381 domain-containing protein [Arenicella xantha]|uniref:Uncharacterized protein DUF4381 n=1 Tax=Arenicella xantha TaxID=644221 RepID=A0A395JL25_9GAMM|nr:DUF4381 domain-containing protein [Arenicella xantha]RBP51289.1 uncharacterized protein DUF4381 [Arenicella xantha]
MSTSTPIDLAERLHDVHLPPEVAAWPLAPAWWLLFGVLVCLTAFFIWWRRRRQRRRAANLYRVSAQSELESAYQQWQESGNDVAFLRVANSLLKRCCLHLQPWLAAGHLGAAWCNELRRLSPGSLSPESELALTVELYQANPTVDVDEVYREVLHWLDQHSSVNQANSGESADEGSDA